MPIYFRIALVSFGIGFGLASFAVFAKAGTYQTTLAECQKRTGLSASLCKGFIKNNLNVESCKKQTNLSDEECTKRIEEIKNDPEFSGNAAPVSIRPTDTSIGSNPVARPVTPDESGVKGLRAKKERQLVELQSKTKILMNSLKEKGADVAAIEKNFGEFEKKSEELLSAYDAYQATYVDTMNDPTSTKEAIRDEARAIVTRSRTVLLEYYKTSILNPLRAVYQ